MNPCSRRQAIRVGLGWAACLGGADGAWAQGAGSGADWPTKSLRFIVPYPSGGPLDVMARLLADKLSLRLGHNVVVENRPGAGGVLGMEQLARAMDGHSFALSAISPLTLLPHLTRVPYEPLTDFAPVTSLMYAPVYVLATPAFAGRQFDDLIALAKSHPGKVSFATSGIGSIGQLMLAQIERRAKVDVVHVPYKGGGAQILTDALGGQFEVFTSNPSPAVAAQIRAGKLRVLAVTGEHRLPSWPLVPTMAELGFAEANLTSLFACFAPARQPAAQVQRMQVLLNQAMVLPDVTDKLTQLDNVVKVGTPTELAALLKTESAAHARTIRDARIRLDE